MFRRFEPRASVVGCRQFSSGLRSASSLRPLLAARLGEGLDVRAFSGVFRIQALARVAIAVAATCRRRRQPTTGIEPPDGRVTPFHTKKGIARKKKSSCNRGQKI